MLLPNLFILGVPKSGTTSLAGVLGSHKDCFLPSIKEPSFFDPYIENSVGLRVDEAFYINLYKKSINNKYRIDASTTYFHNADISEIKRMCPNAFFIVVFRDPFERMVSHLRMDINLYGRVSHSDSSTQLGLGLHDKLINSEYFKFSCYFDRLEDWLEAFGENTLLLENISDSDRVFDWLGLSRIDLDQRNEKRRGGFFFKMLTKYVRSVHIRALVPRRAKFWLKRTLTYKYIVSELERSEISMYRSYYDSLFKQDWEKTKELISRHNKMF